MLTTNKIKVIDSQELFDKITCALTHSLLTCSECGKCGKDGIAVRMTLIEELAEYMELAPPWDNSNEYVQ